MTQRPHPPRSRLTASVLFAACLCLASTNASADGSALSHLIAVTQQVAEDAARDLQAIADEMEELNAEKERLRRLAAQFDEQRASTRLPSRSRYGSWVETPEGWVYVRTFQLAEIKVEIEAAMEALEDKESELQFELQQTITSLVAAQKAASQATKKRDAVIKSRLGGLRG